MKGLYFIVIPYLALALLIGASLYRYLRQRFTYSSVSSELLERRNLFWGSNPWHYGIIIILLAHLLAGLFPGAAAVVLGGPIRILVLEVVGMALGLWTIFGLVVLIARRLRHRSLTRTTSAMDWIVLAVLGVQVVTGVGIAMFTRWGSLWYLRTAAPWFWSLVSFEPDAATVMVLPGLTQLHMVNGFIVLLLIPFSRLAHLFTIPVSYLWRPYQVVIWNQRPGAKAA